MYIHLLKDDAQVPFLSSFSSLLTFSQSKQYYPSAGQWQRQGKANWTLLG